MRNDGIRPAFARLKMVILEMDKMSAKSEAVSAYPMRSILSAIVEGTDGARTLRPGGSAELTELNRGLMLCGSVTRCAQSLTLLICRSFRHA